MHGAVAFAHLSRTLPRVELIVPERRKSHRLAIAGVWSDPPEYLHDATLAVVAFDGKRATELVVTPDEPRVALPQETHAVIVSLRSYGPGVRLVATIEAQECSSP